MPKALIYQVCCSITVGRLKPVRQTHRDNSFLAMTRLTWMLETIGNLGGEDRRWGIAPDRRPTNSDLCSHRGPFRRQELLGWIA